MFHRLDKFAQSDEATKAIFEHFRNVAVACAVYAAAVWLYRASDFASFNGVTAFFGSAILAVVAIGLFLVAIMNAGHRLFNTYPRGSWVGIGWVLYCAGGLTGLVTYAIR